MTELQDFCFRCPCEKNSTECKRNNTLLNDNGTYRCKMLRYLHNMEMK